MRSAENKSKKKRIMPVCSYCQKIRPGKGNPRDPKSWINNHRNLSSYYLSHGICPACFKEQYGEWKEEVA